MYRMPVSCFPGFAMRSTAESMLPASCVVEPAAGTMLSVRLANTLSAAGKMKELLQQTEHH
eukprot:1157764-Pelagomonas_calceolata.AAC.16